MQNLLNDVQSKNEFFFSTASKQLTELEESVIAL